MIVIYIILILIIIALIYIYVKIKSLFKLKVTKEQDDSYSIVYNNKEIYNAKPK